jgi:hypothetical protein
VTTKFIIKAVLQTVAILNSQPELKKTIHKAGLLNVVKTLGFKEEMAATGQIMKIICDTHTIKLD